MFVGLIFSQVFLIMYLSFVRFLDPMMTGVWLVQTEQDGRAFRGLDYGIFMTGRHWMDGRTDGRTASYVESFLGDLAEVSILEVPWYTISFRLCWKFSSPLLYFSLVLDPSTHFIPPPFLGLLFFSSLPNMLSIDRDIVRV